MCWLKGKDTWSFVIAKPFCILGVFLKDITIIHYDHCNVFYYYYYMQDLVFVIAVTTSHAVISFIINTFSFSTVFQYSFPFLSTALLIFTT